MGSENTVDVFLTRELDGIRMLGNIESVEVFCEAEVLEWGCVFRAQWQSFTDLIMQTLGNVFSRAAYSKVVNLVQEEDSSTLKCGGANGLVMRSALEAELRRSQDSSDALFPEFARFGVTLESM